MEFNSTPIMQPKAQLNSFQQNRDEYSFVFTTGLQMIRCLGLNTLFNDVVVCEANINPVAGSIRIKHEICLKNMNHNGSSNNNDFIL